jgi:hypothetical protein
MTREEKDILLKDLCARLPYGVKISVNDKIETLQGIIEYEEFLSSDITEVKPYLLPISSMTEEQQIDFTKFIANGIHGPNILYDWYNRNHFDYRGLIPMGLANDATGLNIY